MKLDDLDDERRFGEILRAALPPLPADFDPARVEDEFFAALAAQNAAAGIQPPDISARLVARARQAAAACGVQALRNDFCPDRDFSRTFTLTKGDFSCGGTVTCRAYNDIRVEFSYPEGLSYFNVRVTEENLRAQVGDVSDALLLEELPEDSALKLFVNALRTFVFTTADFTKKDGVETCGTTLAGLTLTGTFSPEGALLRIDCAENGLSVELQNK